MAIVSLLGRRRETSIDDPGKRNPNEDAAAPGPGIGAAAVALDAR
jgi:hypothetical protein